jgi:hypothetical protein
MRRAAAMACLLCSLLGLAGCGGTRLRDESLLDRCGDAMQQAFPQTEIKVTKKALLSQEQQSYATSIVSAEGERPDLPADSPLPHDIAVECRFDNGILTGFRWTKGPLR